MFPAAVLAAKPQGAHRLRTTGSVNVLNRAVAKPARPLPPDTAAFMSRRLGYDFAHVRIHADPDSAQAARSMDAAALTVGRHILVDAQAVNLESQVGLYVLAHELAHTIQQRTVSDQALRMRLPSAPAWAESQAEAAAEAALFGTRAGAKPALSATGPAIARIDCSTLNYRSCTTGVYKCGYGLSGTCGWVGPSRGCICVGAARPPVQRVLEVLLIIGISITLLATVIAALFDPEPVTKLALAGLSAAQITLLLGLLGYTQPGEEAPTASAAVPSREGATV